MKKVGLIILDGWGLGNRDHSDAIFCAQTQNFDRLWNTYPKATLRTSGLDVGLPDGQMGNSEVGHLNIGAGRIVYQELTRINKSIQDGDFFQNSTLVEAFQYAEKCGVNVHFIGLVSDGGVHSSQEHLHALCDMSKKFRLNKVFIHAFTDGRDCDPKSGKSCLLRLQRHIQNTNIQIATVIGRYYAMDRDKRWERVAKAYHLLVNGEGQKVSSIEALFDQSYAAEITDEFIAPHVLSEGKIQNGDVVVFFNFRTDRPRELTTVLTQEENHEYNMHPLDLHFVTMTQYDEKYRNIHVVFENDNLENTLGEVVSRAGYKQLRIAETEKYPHVTFFFNGGREKEFEGESRLMVHSPKVATYDLQPEMSAFEVRDRLCEKLKNELPDFFCLNFANPDMVGHTGVFEAIVKAVEAVDTCLGTIVELAEHLGYELIITADHGNADFAINPDGSPNTAHSLNPVPIIYVTKNRSVRLRSGILADIAPTILEIMDLEQPMVMTGRSLICLENDEQTSNFKMN
jgi:2,3-bisphosphoglycerate-independent phosphoglycerate mutase